MAMDEDAECYVFVDHSNLWIAGQTAQAKKLKDADRDSRFRVDLGKFLHLLVRDRHISKAFLYGSVPPPNDSIWKAARKKNFKVKTFERSGSGREKELDVAMAHDITKNLYHLVYTNSKDNVIFITVTGDRDLKPPIIDTLGNGIPVELWSWEDAMAREFRQLANTHDWFTAECLDSVEEQFSFTSYMSTRMKKDADPAHAIVYRDVPAGKRFLNLIADHIHRLLRLFYITSVDSQTAGKRDLIVEFPNSKPEVIFKQLRTLERFEFQPCSYPEHWTQSVPLSQRYEYKALVEIDEESLPEVIDMLPDTDEVTASSLSTEHAEDFDDWRTELRRKVGRMTYVKRRRETECKWGDHCASASECHYLHTEEERKLFNRFPHFRFKFMKTKECIKRDQHLTVEQKKWCLFAHDGEDSWCLKCKMYDHLTDNCQVKK
jgi:hypothetical protein